MEFPHGGIQGLASGIDDNGPLRAQLIQVEADGLADAPLDSVTHHGLTHRARQGEADVGT